MTVIRHLTRCIAFRLKIRRDILTTESAPDATLILEKITLVRDIADILRRNVVQASKVHDESSPDGAERWRKASLVTPPLDQVIKQRRRHSNNRTHRTRFQRDGEESTTVES